MVLQEEHYITQTGAVIDPNRIKSYENLFEPLAVEQTLSLGQALEEGQVNRNSLLLVTDLPAGSLLAFVAHHLAYHHVAQGNLDGSDPWLVSFCHACHGGVRLRPQVNGLTYQFRAGAGYKGSFLLQDDQTKSTWDPFTGECLDGPHRGDQLAVTGPVRYVTVDQALTARPDTQIALSKLPFFGRLFAQYARLVTLRPEGFLPPFFYYNSPTRPESDREPLEPGLGIWQGTAAKFYPLAALKARNSAIVDTFNGRRLVVYLNPHSGVPETFYSRAGDCYWFNDDLCLDTGEVVRQGRLYLREQPGQPLQQPLQIFSRWYAFAARFPNCMIYEN